MIALAAAGVCACAGEAGEPAAASRPEEASRPVETARAAPAASVAASTPAAAAAADPALAALPGEIVFVSERAGRAEIHAIHPDGTGHRVIAAAPDADLFPTAASGAGWLFAIRTTGGETDAHREELIAIDQADRAAAPPILTAGRVRNPSQAPGAPWLAVETDRESFRDIYRVSLTGGAPRRLTDSPHGNFEPAVSPDGRLIAFTSSRDGNAEIYVMAADGGREARLTAFHRDDWSPVWAPAGDILSFLSAREGPARVFLMRPDGTEQRRLLGDWDAEVEEDAPTFSPDGVLLALVVRRADGGGEVWVADPRTGKRWPVSAAGARDSSPAWSPDGHYLVYASEVDGQSDLFVARADRARGGPVRITADAAQDWLPRWTAPVSRAPRR